MASSTLGVVVVTFNSADIVLDCLVSLLAADEVRLEIVVVDNASTDETLSVLRNWVSGKLAYVVPDDLPFDLVASPPPPSLTGDRTGRGHCVTLIEAETNSGFAGGVNIGLAHLAAIPEIDRFWVLNPDSAVPPKTPEAFATHGGPLADFSLMGGRVIYYDNPEMIQIDGGTLDRRTGVTGNLGLFKPVTTTPPPEPDEQDFITGASMVASRAFYEAAGPMVEDYFLYYEEVDWAMRRGALPFAHCPDAVVYHRAGTAIGSPKYGRPASAFSLYFKHRGRLRFVRRHLPSSVPVAFAYSLAKAAQLLLRGFGPEAWAIVSGSLNLSPPKEVRARLSEAAARVAFGR